MKIGEQVIEGELADLNEDVLVLPRRKTQIVLTARALPDMTDFDKLVPEPTPKKNFHKGKGWIPDLKDKTYMDSMKRYGRLRVAYFVVKSLVPSEIEWDTVDIDDPNTWDNWEDDFKKSGFTQHECNLVLSLCFSVNQLDERKLEQARQLFVLGQEQLVENSSSQSSEQKTSQNGEPANDSE
ncbi:MAG: hypothetical protein ACXAEN_26240 [Candidatus Thorarchaeota archaeon]|jgi:hypothetical protein